MSDLFHLAVGEVVQGAFALGERTLLLVFQVNCPGCFTYALPLAETIHQDRDRLGLTVLGLSTAFEDFELNTVQHTEQLVHQGTLVGETRRVLERDQYENPLSFPVATDAGIQAGVGETFETNRLRGTPSWILLEADGRILSHAFGELPLNAKPGSD